MIAYKESDVIEPPEKNPAEQQFMQQFPKTCGYVKEDHPDESDEDFLEDEAELVKGLNRTKRQTTGELFLDLRQTRCPLLLVADYRLALNTMYY